MILDLPHDYSLPYIAPRRRTEEQLLISDVFPVEIRDVPSAQAPVVLWCADPASGPVRVPYRRVGDVFVRPVMLSNAADADPEHAFADHAETVADDGRDRAPTAVLSAAALVRMAAAGLPCGLPSRYTMGTPRADRPEPGMDIGTARRMPGRLDEGSVRSRLHSQIGRYMSEFAVVDGVVHVACPYPHLEASPHWFRRCWPREDTVMSPSLLYPIDRHAEAVAAHVEAGGSGERSVLADLAPRIVRHDLLPDPDASPVVARAMAGRILSSGRHRTDDGYRRYGPPIAEEPKSVMAAWAVLRAAYDADDREGIEAALTRFASTPYGRGIVERREVEAVMARLSSEKAAVAAIGRRPCA